MRYAYMLPGLQQANIYWPDTTCQRAIQDRDLKSESENWPGCYHAMIELLVFLYPMTVMPNEVINVSMHQ